MLVFATFFVKRQETSGRLRLIDAVGTSLRPLKDVLPITWQLRCSKLEYAVPSPRPASKMPPCCLSAAVFVQPNTAGQVSGACVFAFLSLLAFERIRPHLSHTDAWMYRIVSGRASELVF